MLAILFAVLAGILTVGAPCILPLLPILLGSSIGRSSKARPLYIVSGFVIVFAALGVFLSFLTARLGLDPGVLRQVAIVLLAVFGLLLIWPKPFELLSARFNKLWQSADALGRARQGNLGGFILGMTLGIIWTPCAGPVLGAILTLIATQAKLAQAAILLVAYAIGAGLPMLLIAYGSQYISTKIRGIARYSVLFQRIFGVLIILLAAAMFSNYDVTIENKLAAVWPSVANLEIALQNQQTARPNDNSSKYGPAPEFIGIDHWLNSAPLTMASLKGKVVLVDFWTYSCINCIRSLAYVTNWYDTYKNQGLVVVGVHTPEFSFEKDSANVADAIKRFKINYPVAQDNEYLTWNAYGNEYWPAEYLIDQNGNIVEENFGEGNYSQTEDRIRSLLDLPPQSGGMASSLGDISGNLANVQSPEMYFGLDRLQNLTTSQSSSAVGKNYNFPASLSVNNFALAGNWQFNGDNIVANQSGAQIRLRFHAAKAYIVAASSAQPLTLKITVDGKTQPDVTISSSRLYTLFDSNDYGDHLLDIQVIGSGFEAFTFTFG